MPQQSLNIRVNPTITADELFDFYEQNDICEVGFGKEVAARILKHPHLNENEGHLVYYIDKRPYVTES